MSCYNELLAQNNIYLSQHQEEILKALADLDYQIKQQKTNKLTSLISKPKSIPGLYIYGSIGTGKSMLMDLFFDNLSIKQKQKIHFHSFMLEVHDYLHNLKKTRSNITDPLKNVAQYIASQYKVLCIDELQIDDIADAMVVGKLFRELIDQDIVIVITSNCAPYQLYKDGLQRESFLPFVEIIESHMQVLQMQDVNDYRKLKMRSLETVYYIYEHEIDSQRFIIDSFLKLSNNATPVNKLLNIDGRELLCPVTAQDCAVFSFEQLCCAPLASVDYIAICQEFNIIIISEIPALTPEEHNEAKRFISLVDVMYELKKTLICSAKTDIESIYKAGKWHFEFKRTISRLYEMQSQEYLES